MSRLSRRALALFCLAAISCADVVGLDDYQRDPCEDFEVQIGDRCTQIGVLPDACGAPGFKPGPHAGCDAILPDDPCAGLLARPGDTSCVTPRCNEHLTPPRGADPVVYVRADAAEGGMGSATLAFAHIADAIAAVESGFKPAIMVEAGEYHENLVVTRPLHLVAACNAILIADEERAAIRIEGRGATDDTRIEGFEIVGGSAGIEVHEASPVVVADTHLRDTEGPAVIGEASGRSEITLQSVLIENARGAGVAVYGAELSIKDSTIRGTRAAAEGEESCGVCVRPSGRVWQRDMAVGSDWDARRSNVGSFSLEGSLLENNAGAGVSVIGTATATVDGSVIRATGDEQAIGLDVEERALGNLHTHLRVSQSLVEGTTHTGIRARNAYLEIYNTTVRDIRGAADSGTGRCFGNGVRVIWDRPADPSKQALHLRESSIVNTHETGVLIQGARALIERSLVRDSHGARCGVELGDGIGVYGQEFAPAEVTLRATRIDRSTRASVASFGNATTEMRSSMAAGAPMMRRDPILEGAKCGELNDDDWSLCVELLDQTLPSALLGGGPCDARDKTVCIAICSREAGNPRQPPDVVVVPERRFWIMGHDEIAPVRADALGCGKIEGLPRNARVTLGTAVVPERGFIQLESGAPLTESTRAFAPALNQVNTHASDGRSTTVHIDGPYDYEVFGQIAIASARAGMAPSGLDLRRAPVFAVSICDAMQERRTPMDCRPLAGVAVSIDRGIPLDLDRDNANSMRIDATALFVNVPVGLRRFELVPTDPSRKLRCSADTRASWSTATELPDNIFEVLARPGYAVNTTIFCELREAAQ